MGLSGATPARGPFVPFRAAPYGGPHAPQAFREGGAVALAVFRAVLALVGPELGGEAGDALG
jgi:hypothetical protein